jgi:two-component system, LytTR family, response regulator
MENKIKCVIIDDDPEAHTTIQGFLENYPLAEIKYSFYNPTEFLKKLNFLEFDLCFLDCLFMNDTMQGAELAIKLKELNKHFIFISANHKAFVEACRMVGALDAIPKPNTERRIKESLEYAYPILFNSRVSPQKDHELCYVAENKGKISIPVPDILYVRTDPVDPRNKITSLKNNISYTLMDYKFNKLLKLSPNFVLVNRSEVISYEIVEELKGEFIYLKQNENKEVPRTVTLSKTCRKNFNINFR